MAWTEPELDYNVLPGYVYPPRPRVAKLAVYGLDAPPPGSDLDYAVSALGRTRKRRLIVPFPSPTFFGPPFVPSDNIYVAPNAYARGRQRTRFNYFPEYPVPTLYRPCELEVLQIPTNPYARLHRHVIKAIIYMRTTYVGDPTC